MGAARELCFTIEGEFLTEHFRDKVLEGNWNEAVEGLRDSLIGISYDQVYSILKGEMKLVGTSADDSIKMVEDNDCQEYLDDMDFIYGGRLKSGNEVYKCYGYVKTFGDADLMYIKTLGYNSREDECRWDIRARFYKSNASDIIVDYGVRGGSCFYLFERVSMTPPWVDTFKSEREAVEWSIKNGYISDLGYIESAAEKKENRLKRAEDEIFEGFSEKVKVYEEATGLKLPSVDEFMESQRKADDALKFIPDLREKILEQANGDFYPHDFGGTVGLVQIPRAPLVIWALERTKAADLPEWELVCPSGLKMTVDNRYHSDWYIGAGIDLALYQEELQSSQYDLLRKVQEEYLNVKASILVQGKPFAVGTIIHPMRGQKCTEDHIAVIPNAGTSWYECVKDAAGVIVENGGAMSHLAVVGLEEQFLVMRVEEARKKYKVGQLVAMNAKDGTIEIMASM